MVKQQRHEEDRGTWWETRNLYLFGEDFGMVFSTTLDWFSCDLDIHMKATEYHESELHLTWEFIVDGDTAYGRNSLMVFSKASYSYFKFLDLR